MRIVSLRGQTRSPVGIYSTYSRSVPVVKGWRGARPAVSRNHSTCGHLVVGRRGIPVVAAQSSSASDDADVENVVIIGSGPAGYTAAIYASRASLSPLVFEGYQAGGVRGGQLMTTTEVENFPGFPEGITGPDLMDRMRQQAERWGSNLLLEDVESVDLSVRPFVIKGTETTVKAHSLIIATGATAKRLNIPSEETFWSRGISACAICDGAEVLAVRDVILEITPANTYVDDVVVAAPIADPINFTFTSIFPDTTSMRSSVNAQLASLFSEFTAVGSDLTEDAYRTAIFNTIDTENGDRIESFVLASPSGDLEGSSGQIQTLGQVNF